MRRDPLAHTAQSVWQQRTRPRVGNRSESNQQNKSMTAEEENSADPRGKYIPLDVTDTYRMFKDRAQIETAILLKVYHSPIYVP